MQRLTRGAASIAARASKGAVGSTALKVAAATIPRRAYFAETLRLKPINSESKTTDTPTYITDANGKTISPWHDIPLRRAGAPNLFNFVCEIPRGTTPKYEISTGKEHNPIVQDKTKDGKPRFYAFKSLINYGALPQTYEDPDHKTGQVYTVKVLGALAMIDGGEADWKLLAIRTDDPLAAQVDDVLTAPPGVQRLMDEIRTWFRTYKIPEGKGENSFAFEGKWLGAAEALKVIESTHGQWRKVVDGRPRNEGTQYGEAALKAAKKKGPWLPPADWQP